MKPGERDGEAEGMPQIGAELQMEFERRRISAQHRQLDEFYHLTCQALAEDSSHIARAAFERFHDAVITHVSLEEEHYFPTLEALRPTLREMLAPIEAEHAALHRQLNEIRALFDTNQRERSRRQLDEFADSLAAHERREEQLLADILKARTSHE